MEIPHVAPHRVGAERADGDIRSDQRLIAEAAAAENAVDESGDYLTYVRNPASGFRSLPLPFEPGRGNEMSVYVA